MSDDKPRDHLQPICEIVENFAILILFITKQFKYEVVAVNFHFFIILKYNNI